MKWIRGSVIVLDVMSSVMVVEVIRRGTGWGWGWWGGGGEGLHGKIDREREFLYGLAGGGGRKGKESLRMRLVKGRGKGGRESLEVLAGGGEENRIVMEGLPERSRVIGQRNDRQRKR